MIENKFLYFQTKEKFLEKLNSCNIDHGSIVFVKGSGIWTHGQDFPSTRISVNSNEEQDVSLTVAQSPEIISLFNF